MENYIKGRGAKFKPHNHFLKTETVTEHIEGLDEPLIDGSEHTKVFIEHPKKILNKVESPDVYGMYSLNPYQGCEHGCIYCYARNSHQYWGFSAGLDFERNIIAKPDAPKLLEEAFNKPSWKSCVITLSGNTDCYQPLERKMKITRQLLEILLKYKNPVGIITKNSLILRDIDILEEMANLNLVHVMVSITSLKEELRRTMEPRTASAANRLKSLEQLSLKNISCGVMNAPIIPGLNNDEIPQIIKAAAEHGARNAGYTIVRLNGAISEIFYDWLQKNFPNRVHKVWEGIKNCHGGQVSDSRFGKRMRGDGKIAESIAQLFNISVKKYMNGKEPAKLDTTIFYAPQKEKAQMSLF